MARECIFCGATPLTNEHVFPLWLSPLFPLPVGKRLYIDSFTFTDGVQTGKRTRYPINIDLKVRQVCKTCNNGWMSALEAAASPIISRIHAGALKVLTREHLTVLASWAAKTATTIQYLGPNPFVPPHSRTWLATQHSTPPNTFVWLGRYDGAGVASTKSNNLFFHHLDGSRLDFPNGQFVVFTVGSLIFLVLALHLIRYVDVKVEFPVEVAKDFRQIWPIRSEIMEWPQRGISDVQREIIGNIDWNDRLIVSFPLTLRTE